MLRESILGAPHAGIWLEGNPAHELQDGVPPAPTEFVPREVGSDRRHHRQSQRFSEGKTSQPYQSSRGEQNRDRRDRQANLFGPAGFVSADDGEVIEFSQEGFEQKPFHRTIAELGGREIGNTDHMVTETLIRGMYDYWRRVMEI